MLIQWKSQEGLFNFMHSMRTVRLKARRNATPKGFEPLRAEPNGFRVHLLSHSDTVSCFAALSIHANASFITRAQRKQTS